jgi:hypothetical protein
VEGNPVVTAAVRARLAELEALWSALRAEVDRVETADIAAFNKLLQSARIDGVVVAKKPRIAM